MKLDVHTRIGKLAARQHGLVTRAQLLGAGISSRAVDYRIRTRRLQPIQRGVYRLGPIASPVEREMAAVLACGPEAVMSHRSAAAFWGLLPRGNKAPVHVTVRARHRRRRPGVLVHCSPDLPPEEATKIDRIPVTTPARTVIDLAGTVRPRRLEQALAAAEREGLTSHPEVASLIDRHPRRRGVRTLRALLERDAQPAFTRSDAEESFLSLVEKAQLERPESNVMVAGYEVDFLWRAERLVAEVDGFAFHSSRARFESDRKKDGHLSTRGFRVIRVTWRQLTREPEAVLVRLAQSLTAASLRDYTRWC